MRAVGMGAVYTRTSAGTPLRSPSPEEEQALLATCFAPYAAAVTDLVADRLAVHGRAVMVDVHSNPPAALPYELHADQGRPALCIGVDAFHTPPSLIAAARRAFAGLGDTAVNEPFRGAYVPSRWYGRNRRVAAVMLEIRRDVYRDGLGPVSAALAEVVRTVIAEPRSA